MALFRKLSIRNVRTSIINNLRPEEKPLPKLPPIDEEQDSIRKDTFFYYVPLVILVEGTLFKISRIYFEGHSKVFRDTYLRNRKGNDPLKGFSDGQPLRLDGIEASEFKSLLKAMNQKDMEADTNMTLMECIAVLKLALMWQMKIIEDWAIDNIPTQIRGSKEWTSALKLSTQMNIPRLRAVAIKSLAGNLSPLQKFELAIECKINAWLSEVYTLFVTREEGLSEEDEEKLGWERTSKLFRLRNRRFEQLQAFQSAMRQNYKDKRTFEQWYSVGSDIRTAFASDFTASINSPMRPNLRSDIKTVTEQDVVQRDVTFYFVDIIFHVEDTLFRVPRHLFVENSSVFRDMFQLPVAKGVVPDGATEDQPLRLEGVQKTDFRWLLWAMKCPTAKSVATKGSRNAEDTPPMQWREWVSVLELSSMWQMDKIRSKATRKILEKQVGTDEWKVLLRLSTKLSVPELREPAIQKLSPILPAIEMIELGIECRVHAWLLEGYSALALKEGGITLEDERRLGPKTTSRLFRVRELLFQSRKSGSSLASVPNEIIRLFPNELRDAGWEGK